MDRGYDNGAMHDACADRGAVAIFPLRETPSVKHGDHLAPVSYRGRAAIEREFGRLKHEYGLAPLRVRGLDRVALHADLTMLARLSQALARARPVPLAA